MKIAKAIEILTLMGTPDFPGHTEDILAARQLGIFALQYVEDARDITAPYLSRLLPGETEE